jgi:hypothetical protein
VIGYVRTALRPGRVALLLVVALLACLALALGPASPARADPTDCVPTPDGCVDVDTDLQHAAFVGTGGLLLPADSFTGSSADRSDAAACPDCQWALVPVCKRDDVGGVGCGPAATSCPVGERRMVVLLARPPDLSWVVVGSVCVNGAPLTVDDVADRLADVVIERVPRLEPTYQPPGGTVVNLPTLFASGQPARLDTRRFELVGFAVVLDARASWRWQFGDGGALVTDQPGGPWPDRSVSHTYARPGTVAVQVSSRWQGWFTIDGLGPFLVAGAPVEQTAGPLPLVVHEARAVLVSD